MHIFAKLALVNACLVGLAVGQDLTTGLVGRYPLDGTGQDLSSQNNPLLMYNVQPATDRSGNTAGAVYLNGSTSWMVSTADSAISGSMPRTISAWIKSDDFGFYKGNPMVIGLGDKSSTATLFDLSLQSPGPSNNGWSGVRTAGVFLHGSWMNADTPRRPGRKTNKTRQAPFFSPALGNKVRTSPKDLAADTGCGAFPKNSRFFLCIYSRS